MFRFKDLKRLSAVLTALLLVLTAFPAVASAAPDQEELTLMFTKTSPGGKYMYYLDGPDTCVPVSTGMSSDYLYAEIEGLYMFSAQKMGADEEPFSSFLVAAEGTKARFFETAPEKTAHTLEYGWIYTPQKYRENKYLRDAVAGLKNKPMPGEWVCGEASEAAFPAAPFEAAKNRETRTYNFASFSYVSSQAYTYSDDVEGLAWTLDTGVLSRYEGVQYDAVKLTIGAYGGREILIAADSAVSGYFSGTGTETKLVRCDFSEFSEDPGTFESPAWNTSNPVIYACENESRSDYESSWSQPVTSLIYQDADGSVIRAAEVKEGVCIEKYNSSFGLTASKLLDKEGPYYAGAFIGEKYNFLFYGFDNENQSSLAEVFRAVRFSKDWERIDSASVRGNNTRYMPAYGSLGAAENKGMLYIAASHAEYGHTTLSIRQSSMTMVLDQEKMEFTEVRSKGDSTKQGYVTHSFNQYALVDKEGRLVFVHHGTQSPRALTLLRMDARSGSKNIGEADDIVNFYELMGSGYQNNTGAMLGGLAESSNNYLMPFAATQNTEDAWNRGTMNIKVAAVGKQIMGTTVTTLTKYKDTDPDPRVPKIAKIDNDRFLVVWAVHTKHTGGSETAAVSYQFVDGRGRAKGSIQTKNGYMSDCQPVLINGKVTWYADLGNGPVFYCVDAESGAFSSKAAYVEKPMEFNDVRSSDYFFDAVRWAFFARPQITDGVSRTRFAPEDPVTRGQAVTFLWRAMGEPEPKSTAAPFDDIKKTDYFYKPVLWAFENGITDGTSSTKFSPDSTLKRGQIVTFLWRTLGKPGDTNDLVWYADAEKWAGSQNLLDGTAIGYKTNEACPRADVILYMYRALEGK